MKTRRASVPSEDLKQIEENAISEQLKSGFPVASSSGKGLVMESIHRRGVSTILDDMIEKKSRVIQETKRRKRRRRRGPKVLTLQ